MFFDALFGFSIIFNHIFKPKQNTKMKTNGNNNESIQKTKIVKFATDVDIIKFQLLSRRNGGERRLNWYKMDEIKAFRRDANMISLAFLKQKKASSNEHKLRLEQSKTICALGLENRINFKRRLQKTLIIRFVLKAQAELQKKYSFPTSESKLAVVSSAATFEARFQAIEDGKRASKDYA